MCHHHLPHEVAAAVLVVAIGLGGNRGWAGPNPALVPWAEPAGQSLLMRASARADHEFNGV